MENQEKLMQFVTWLGENVPELKGKAPEQIVETVNKLSASEQGQQMLQGLIKEFESSMTGMFKKGGKLGYLLCLEKGGNIQDCGCGKKIDKKQPGGRVLDSEQYPHASRKDAIDAARQLGFEGSDARKAYRDSKKIARQLGFRGNNLRQVARYNLIDTAYPRATEEISRIEPLSAGPQINMPSNTLVANNAGFAPIKRSGRPDVVTFSNQSFDSAFANARKMGLSEFAWQDGQYDRYSTKLDPEEQSSAQQQEYEYNQQLVENAVNSPKLRDKMKSGILSTLNYSMK